MQPVIERLSVETARQLLDFTGGKPNGIVGPHAAHEQLCSAVATYNLLTRQNVAYLADEVGMGKTYVALGALALFRHFNPQFRVLVIAPRENIQDKWAREWRNFVRQIVKVDDLAVKGIGGEPARALVKAATLPDLVTKVSRDPDRDFIARLTSFSLPIAANGDTAQKPREELLRALPWLNKDLLHLKLPKETYKRNFGMAVNCALPQFDLVIVDEGHNLKAGWRLRGATRNVVVGCALGGKVPEAAAEGGFRGYGLKARRVLFLSATPIEHDYLQLWNQLDLLGHGENWTQLADTNIPDDKRREQLRELLIRRVGRLKCGNETLTKNQYRQEWRAGGASIHDQPLAIPDDRQKLTVALIQKKVSEVLGNAEHNHSFQVGLLASFESFEQTASNRLKRVVLAEADTDVEEEAKAFYTHPSTTADEEVREGPDVDAVDAIAKDYQKRFLKSLPHPKMDALIERLSSAFVTGQKALVFVRRVASVDELQRKLEERYDTLLFERLRACLRSAAVRAEMEHQFGVYQEQRARERHSRRVLDDAGTRADSRSSGKEISNTDTFFAWFFRGEGPPEVLSGARLADRLDSVSGDYGTLFEDNYVAAVLGVEPSQALPSLLAETRLDLATLRSKLKRRAQLHLPASSRTISVVTFRAFQQAGLELLKEYSSASREIATAVLAEVFPEPATFDRLATTVPEPDKWLAVETFFTALRLPARAALRKRLWPDPTEGTARHQVRESEIRRLLLATMVRKGHSIIDLFVLVANRIGTLQLRKRDVANTDLATEFLDLLQRQADLVEPGFNSFTELADAAEHYELLLTQNVPDLQPTTALSQVPGLFGNRLLRSQKPVGGMAGSVNGGMVRQFRMPGYPLVLISTDLLQEGEDLHTFCSSIFHYGIAWMPSALEQRVGRIDRVGSQTERRLAKLSARPDGRDRLQVYYPHLHDTVEVLQVRRVLHRLNRFLRLMHENLGLPERERPSIDLKEAMLLAPIDAVQSDEPLKSSFDVTDEMLRGRTKPLSTSTAFARHAAERFTSIASSTLDLGLIEWSETETASQRSGTRHMGSRRQPFTLLLRSIRGAPVLRCVSPVGEVFRSGFDTDLIARVSRRPLVRVSLVLNERIDAYEVAVEGDLLYGARADHAVSVLIRAVTDAADEIELLHQELDPRYEQITAELLKESEVER